MRLLLRVASGFAAILIPDLSFESARISVPRREISSWDPAGTARGARPWPTLAFRLAGDPSPDYQAGRGGGPVLSGGGEGGELAAMGVRVVDLVGDLHQVGQGVAAPEGGVLRAAFGESIAERPRPPAVEHLKSGVLKVIDGAALGLCFRISRTGSAGNGQALLCAGFREPLADGRRPATVKQLVGVLEVFDGAADETAELGFPVQRRVVLVVGAVRFEDLLDRKQRPKELGKNGPDLHGVALDPIEQGVRSGGPALQPRDLSAAIRRRWR